MRVSFDLDDTLICYQSGVPQERTWLRWFAGEPLRLGTRELWRALKKRGFQVGVYTTSYRTPAKIRFWLA